MEKLKNMTVMILMKYKKVIRKEVDNTGKINYLIYL